MKISKNDFENKLSQAFPNGYFYSITMPMGCKTIFSHAMIPSNLSEWQLEARAICIWYDDEVTKDLTGLFLPINPVIPPFPPAHQGYTNAYIYTNDFQGQDQMGGGSSYDKEKQKSVPKCICGCHSVGSNRHSDWCEIKGD